MSGFCTSPSGFLGKSMDETGSDTEDSSKQPKSDLAVEFLPSDLFIAVQQGKLEVVETILSCAKGNVNAVDEFGHTALFSAAKEGDVKIVEALLNKGADVNILDVLGQTALFAAVKDGNAGVVSVLLRFDADVTVVNKLGETVLHVAAKKGDAEVVQALLNVSDSESHDALFAAAECSNAEIVQVLMGHISDVNKTFNWLGQTALFAAAKNSDVGVIHELLKGGANTHITDSYKQTPLFVAVKHNNLEVIEVLLNHSADVNAVDHDGQTALFVACESGHFTVVDTLLSSGANVKITNVKKQTPLFTAAKQGNVEVVQALIKHGADVTASDIDGGTALFAAARHGNLKVVEVLLGKDLDLSKTDNLGQTVLFAGVKGGNSEVVQALLTAGADADKPDDLGRTVLFAAVEGGNSEVVQEFLSRGADVNKIDKVCQTPLFFVVKCLPQAYLHNQEANVTTTGVTSDAMCQIFKILLEKGANADARNAKEETPLLHYLAHGRSLTKNRESVHTLIEVCQFLIKTTKVSISGRTGSGLTVIHLVLQLLRDVLKEETLPQETQAITMPEIAQSCLNILRSIFSSDGWSNPMATRKDDEEGNTPIHVWASLTYPREQVSDDNPSGFNTESSLESIFTQMADELLSHGAKVATSNDSGQTALHMAQTWTAAKFLIDKGADPNTPDSNGNTPLLQYVNHNVEKVILDWNEILNSGMNPWQVNRHGTTILGSLLEKDAFSEIEAFLGAVSKLDHQECLTDDNGDTCLHVICQDKRETFWKLHLIDSLAKSALPIINYVNRKGQTALHILCESGKVDGVSKEMIERLRAYGARGDIPDKKGNTCFDVASSTPGMNELLEKNVKLAEVAFWHPWSSISEKHKEKLTEVARCQNAKKKQSIWYHTSPIGCGAFGHVHAGIDVKDGREVAVKCLEKARMVQQPVGTNEIKVLLRLVDCEHVVRYISCQEDQDFLYIVLDLMEGTVVDLLNYPVGEEELVSLLRDVLSGLAFLHDRKILHRDIKPCNILYKDNPKLILRLADFGLSSRGPRSNSLTVMNSKTGSRPWMAPELFTSEGTKVPHSEVSDIFAYGLVLHYVLANKKHPFGPESEKNSLLVTSESESNFFEECLVIDECLTPEATDLVRFMLEYNKDSRPTAAEALKHPLFWSRQKKIQFLVAVGNQNEFVRQQEPLVPFLKDLEDSHRQFHHTPWAEHIQGIYEEVIHSGKSRSYKIHSIVDLMRFLRNVYSHINERTDASKEKLLTDYLLLSKFPYLVIDIYKAVKIQKWDQRQDIASCLAAK